MMKIMNMLLLLMTTTMMVMMMSGLMMLTTIRLVLVRLCSVFVLPRVLKELVGHGLISFAMYVDVSYRKAAGAMASGRSMRGGG